MALRSWIGTPCFGGLLSSLYVRSVLNFQAACLGRNDLKFDSVANWGDSLITRARQGLVTQLLGHSTATHLLFADSNIGFWPDQVFRLLMFDSDFAAGCGSRRKSTDQEGRGEGGSRTESIFDFEPRILPPWLETDSSKREPRARG